MRVSIIVVVAILIISMTATPVSAQFFLCEKTNQEGDSVPPDSPQYDRLDYDSPMLPLAQQLVRLALTGMIIFGIIGGVYASVRDATYTPEDDDDPARFVRMRIKVIFGGLGVPALIMVGGFIVERLTRYETTCMLPSIL